MYHTILEIDGPTTHIYSTGVKGEKGAKGEPGANGVQGSTGLKVSGVRYTLVRYKCRIKKSV